MKVIEVKGFVGFALATLVVIAIVGVFVVIPVLLTQWGWNTWVTVAFEGPPIKWWQATILAMAILLGLVLVARQFISFEVELVNIAPAPSADEEEPTLDDTENTSGTSDSDNDASEHPQAPK